MRPLLLPLVLLAATLPAQERAGKAPGEGLRLALESSREIYSEVEPVIVRLWLVNPGTGPAAVLAGRVRPRRVPGEPSPADPDAMAVGGVWLLDREGERPGADAFRPRPRIRLAEPGFREKGQVGLGPGQAGRPRRLRFFLVPAGGRVLLGEFSDLLGARDFTGPGGRTRRSRSMLRPGRYLVKAAYRAIDPGPAPDPDDPGPPGRRFCRAVDLSTTCPVQVVPCPREVRLRWESLERIRLGMTRRMVEGVLGRPWSERFRNSVITRQGERGLLELRWRLGGLAEAVPDRRWGRVRSPAITARFTRDGKRLVLLRGSFFGHPCH